MGFTSENAFREERPDPRSQLALRAALSALQPALATCTKAASHRSNHYRGN